MATVLDRAGLVDFIHREGVSESPVGFLDQLSALVATMFLLTLPNTGPKTV